MTDRRKKPKKPYSGGKSFSERLTDAKRRLPPLFEGTISGPFKSAEPLDQKIEQLKSKFGRAGR